MMWDFLIISPKGDPELKRKRFNEEQIIHILKEHDTGAMTESVQAPTLNYLMAALMPEVKS
jgi:hypothetical protein